MTDLDKMARELLAAECTDRAASLEKSAASDRETGDSIQEAIDSGVELTPDEPQDVAAGLLNDAERAEVTAGLLRRAAALLTAPPGYVLADRAQLESAFGAVQATMDAAYQRRFPECCGSYTPAGCCGNPREAWSEEDRATMDVLHPAEQTLAAMLAAAPNRAEPRSCRYCIGATTLIQ